MTDEVIDQIVQQVLAAIQTRGLAVDTAPQATVQAQLAPAPAAATVQMPLALALPAAKPKVQTAGAGASTTIPQRKVFITAEMLQRRLATDDGPSRTVELAYNEFLTPAAMDLADQRHLTVRKQPKQLASLAKVTNPPAAAKCPFPVAAKGASKGRTLGLVISKPNAMVRGVLDGLERDGILALDFNRTNCWIENTQMLCNAIVSGSVTGGVVMVPQAADVVMLANKIRGIRAVQGVKPEGLTAAMGRLAPNVLAMEHSSSTFHEIRTMLRTFAVGSASTGRSDAVMDAIEKLERA